MVTQQDSMQEESEKETENEREQKKTNIFLNSNAERALKTH